MAAVRSPADLVEEHGFQLERCAVSLWRGYVTARFYAHLPDGLTTGESSAFRWRKSGPPPDAGAPRAAYDGLVAELEASGWTALAEGAAWFETTFGRYVLSADLPTQTEAPPPRRPAQKVPPPAPPAIVIEPAAVAPPAVVRASAPAPPAEPSGARRGRRAGLVGGAGALAVGAVAVALVMAGSKPQPAPTSTPPVARTGQHPAAVASPGAHAAVPPAIPNTATVALKVSGIGRGSWLQVRRDSKTGAQLYNGVVTDGKSVRFTGARLWVQFGAAGNLAITVNGKRLPYNGTIEHTFRAGR
jgi:hypothetical protein